LDAAALQHVRMATTTHCNQGPLHSLHACHAGQDHSTCICCSKPNAPRCAAWVQAASTAPQVLCSAARRSACTAIIAPLHLQREEAHIHTSPIRRANTLGSVSAQPITARQPGAAWQRCAGPGRRRTGTSSPPRCGGSRWCTCATAGARTCT